MSNSPRLFPIVNDSSQRLSSEELQRHPGEIRGPRGYQGAGRAFNSEVEDTLANELQRQFDAIPGNAEEKRIVFVQCEDQEFVYPEACCQDFDDVLAGALFEHFECGGPAITGANVRGRSSIYCPPDMLVEALAQEIETILCEAKIPNPAEPEPNR